MVGRIADLWEKLLCISHSDEPQPKEPCLFCDDEQFPGVTPDMREVIFKIMFTGSS